MAFDSWPNAGHSGGDITATEHEALLSAGNIDGLIGTPALTPIAYADGSSLNIRIRAGRELRVGGVYATTGPTEIVQSIATNSSGSTRTDLLVARLSRATGAITHAIITGTPGAGAPSPLRDAAGTGYRDLPLMTIPVANGASAVNAAQVAEVGWYLSGSGVACRTTASLPPVEAGLIASIYGTGERYIGEVTATTSTWRLLGSYGGWVPIPLGGGLVAGGSVAAVATCRKLDGIVYTIFGVQRTGGTLVAGRNVTLGTMPEGYRPPYAIRCAAVIDKTGDTIAANCTLATNGVITIVGYGQDIVNGDYVYVSIPPFPVI